MRIADMQHFAKEFQQEEELLIDRSFLIEGKQVYLLAAFREKKQVRVCLLAEHPGKKAERSQEEKIWKKTVQGKLTKREELLGRKQDTGIFSEIRGIKTPHGEFEASSANSGGFEEYDVEGFITLLHFVERGISAEAVNTIDLSEMDYIVMTLEGEFESIPFSREELTLLYQLEDRSVPVKKKMRLEIGKQYNRSFRFFCEALERDVVFYINEVALYDSRPDLQKSRDMLLLQEENQRTRKDIMELTEELCPEGMCHLAITCECEDGLLEFYLRKQLEEKVGMGKGRATSVFFAIGQKQGPECGPHGLKSRRCLIQYPIPSDTREIEVELLMARVPAKTEFSSCSYPSTSVHICAEQ